MTFKRPNDLGIRAASLLMLALWLGTLALVVSPQLHDRLHSDAQNLSHRCLVTQVQQHGVLAGLMPAVSAVLIVPTATLQQNVEAQFFPSLDYRLSPSRAPPSFYSSKTVAG